MTQRYATRCIVCGQCVPQQEVAWISGLPVHFTCAFPRHLWPSWWRGAADRQEEKP